MLEARSPASSLLDLAYLGLSTADPLADPAFDRPSAGPRLAHDPDAGFERPHTGTVPADAGKMADNQTLTAADSRLADRRDVLLDLDTAPERQPVFVLPQVAWQQPALYGDVIPAPPVQSIRAPTVRESGSGFVGVTPQEPVRPSARRLPDKGEPPISDPEVVGVPPANSMSGGGQFKILASAKVTEVDFVGDAITVLADPGRTTYPGTGSPWAPGLPEYKDADANGEIVDGPNEWAIPTAITMGHKAKVTARFKADWGTTHQERNGPIYIQGLWKGYQVSLKLPEQEAAVSPDGTTLTYPATETLSAVPSYVDAIRSADIEWQVRIPGDMTWQPAGTSRNEMFVTLDQPQGTVYHTLISLSTRASWGDTEQAEVVSDTYEVFQGKMVHARPPAYAPPGSVSDVKYNKSVQPLHYYKNWQIAITATSPLLEFGDGECGAWVGLFIDAVKMHGGIPVADVELELSDGAYDKFAVASWGFQQPGTFPGSKYPFANFVRQDGVTQQADPDGTWRYVWRTDYDRDATDLAGVGGQNVNNPASLFRRHYLVSYTDDQAVRTLYDPSYGTGPFSDVSTWESQSVAALVRDETIVDGSQSLRRYRFTVNPPGQDLREVGS